MADWAMVSPNPVPVLRPAPVYTLPSLAPGAPVYALWLGSGADADEVAALYERVAATAPGVFELLETAYKSEVLRADETSLGRDTTVIRLLVGPLPGPDYAWATCNFLHTRQASLFCQPQEVRRRKRGRPRPLWIGGRADLRFR